MPLAVRERMDVRGGKNRALPVNAPVSLEASDGMIKSSRVADLGRRKRVVVAGFGLLYRIFAMLLNA
jgi:hypothetical protein